MAKKKSAKVDIPEKNLQCNDSKAAEKLEVSEATPEVTPAVDLPDNGETTGRTVTVLTNLRFSVPVPADVRTPEEKQAYAYKMLQNMTAVLNKRSAIKMEHSGIPSRFLL
jgi:hypothetical protein